MIYLDSSALFKLVVQEQESDPLQVWLEERDDIARLSSELSRVEVSRACQRLGGVAPATGRIVLSGLDLIPLTGAVVDLATEIGTPVLPSLAALHLASASLLGDDLTAVVAYDHRLIAAAQEIGVEVASPGRS